MKKFLLVTAIIMSFTLSEVRAQLEFRPGYIVNTEGDTIPGKIKTRMGGKPVTNCAFRSGTSTVKYSPSQIKGFGFADNRHYVSGIEPDSFVEVLIRGALSLYKSGPVFFVTKKDDQPVRLETGHIMDTADVKMGMGTDVVYGYREDVRWKGRLTVLTSDHSESVMKLQELTFDEKSLRKFVKEYNLGTGAKYREY